MGLSRELEDRGERDLVVEDRIAVEVEASSGVNISEVVKYGGEV